MIYATMRARSASVGAFVRFELDEPLVESIPAWITIMPRLPIGAVTYRHVNIAVAPSRS